MLYWFNKDEEITLFDSSDEAMLLNEKIIVPKSESISFHDEKASLNFSSMQPSFKLETDSPNKSNIVTVIDAPNKLNSYMDLKTNMIDTIENYKELLNKCQKENEVKMLKRAVESLEKQLKELEKVTFDDKTAYPAKKLHNNKMRALSQMYYKYCKQQFFVCKKNSFQNHLDLQSQLGMNKFIALCKDMGLTEGDTFDIYVNKFYES